MDHGGPAEDFIPPADDGMNDIDMVDEGVPVMVLSSQQETAVMALSSWNLVVSVSCSLVAFSRLMSNSFMISC